MPLIESGIKNFPLLSILSSYELTLLSAFLTSSRDSRKLGTSKFNLGGTYPSIFD
jgi:hypothetical protein